MKISPTETISFNARIIPCRALDTALERAQRDALSGTEEGIKRASELYNNLRAIETDTKSDIFFIDTHAPNYHPYIRLDGYLSLLEPLGTTGESVANSIRNSINKLINETHLKNAVKDEAKDVDLTKAFFKWL